MTLWIFPGRLVLELERPDVELVVERCSRCGRARARWLDSQTGRVLAVAVVGQA